MELLFMWETLYHVLIIPLGSDEYQMKWPLADWIGDSRMSTYVFTFMKPSLLCSNSFNARKISRGQVMTQVCGDSLVAFILFSLVFYVYIYVVGSLFCEILLLLVWFIKVSSNKTKPREN